MSRCIVRAASAALLRHSVVRKPLPGLAMGLRRVNAPPARRFLRTHPHAWKCDDESCKCGHCLKTRNDNSQPVKQANDSSNEQTDHPEKDGTKNKNIEKENVAFAWISGCLLGTIIGTITLHGMLFGRDKIEELIQTRRSLTEELKRRDLAAFERGYIKPEAVREIVTELEKAESRLNTAVTNLDETGLQALAKEEMWELKRANNDVWSITRELRNSVGRKRLYR